MIQKVILYNITIIFTIYYLTIVIYIDIYRWSIHILCLSNRGRAPKMGRGKEYLRKWVLEAKRTTYHGFQGGPGCIVKKIRFLIKLIISMIQYDVLCLYIYITIYAYCKYIYIHSILYYKFNVLYDNGFPFRTIPWSLDAQQRAEGGEYQTWYGRYGAMVSHQVRKLIIIWGNTKDIWRYIYIIYIYG